MNEYESMSSIEWSATRHDFMNHVHSRLPETISSVKLGNFKSLPVRPKAVGVFRKTFDRL